ncbi:hypothetical protein NUU61_010025 [Penicillium alfredii]|uniref:Uncharacterized protein n=1 Tax=Penicillium alfredii TaxID=1506179 RepID=A0A9W9EHC9_9EURO|nr:uncharacterized protein NUU61_010025 [Penicillium alfredii]KAJ5081761.1 hypothetical protein NUU61_010025 [Penicillium alfredii]
MSLGRWPRGNADFGRSATNTHAAIGCGGEDGGGRCRGARRLAAFASGAPFDSVPATTDQSRSVQIADSEDRSMQ